jgi:hypothetical protein
MTKAQFHAIETPRCDASARKAAANPPIYTQWMPTEDARQLEREVALLERALLDIENGYDQQASAQAADTLRTLEEVRNTK